MILLTGRKENWNVRQNWYREKFVGTIGKAFAEFLPVDCDAKTTASGGGNLTIIILPLNRKTSGESY